MVNVTAISADQFVGAVARQIQLPLVQELEFYAVLDGWYLGVVTRDSADDDFGYVVLAPDQNRSQRAIRLDAGIDTREAARAQLIGELECLAAGGKQVHPQ